MAENIRYINITAIDFVHGYIAGVLELAIAAALTAPFGPKNTVAIKLLDAMVVSIHYKNITVAVHGHTEGEEEEAVAAALTAPFGH